VTVLAGNRPIFAYIGALACGCNLLKRSDKIFYVLFVFSQNYQAPFAGTKPRLSLHGQRAQLGNRLIVAGDDYFLTRRQSGYQFGQTGLRFFNGAHLIHNSFPSFAAVLPISAIPKASSSGQALKHALLQLSPHMEAQYHLCHAAAILHK